MATTLIHAQARRAPDDPSPMAALARKYHRHCWGDDFPVNGAALFERHNDLVREASAGRRFLEYAVGSGWAPLCEFLGVAVPEGREFPRADDWVEYKKKVEREQREQSQQE
jgi:hypothetical protein